eukprot:193975-Prymnesium_polylepis.1
MEWRIQPSRSERSTISASSGNPSSLRSWFACPPFSRSAFASPASRVSAAMYACRHAAAFGSARTTRISRSCA